MLGDAAGRGETQESLMVLGTPGEEIQDMVTWMKGTNKQKQVWLGKERTQFKTYCILGS